MKAQFAVLIGLVLLDNFGTSREASHHEEVQI